MGYRLLALGNMKLDARLFSVSLVDVALIEWGMRMEIGNRGQ